MRVWDVAAGYLNRQSLLAEHRELHGLRSILLHGKRGYSRHPETLRWVGCLPDLAQRHEALVAEMQLRGYVHRTPVQEAVHRLRWPKSYVTAPVGQFALLKMKYTGKPMGRIHLPRNAQELWANHKYSVMARDTEAYRSMGRRVSTMRRDADLSELTQDLVRILRKKPGRGCLINALEHMWGHVSKAATPEEKRSAEADASKLFAKIWQLALRLHEPYLTASTALSELAVFVEAE